MIFGDLALGDLGELRTSSELSQDFNSIFKFTSKRLALIVLALFFFIVAMEYNEKNSSPGSHRFNARLNYILPPATSPRSYFPCATVCKASVLRDQIVSSVQCSRPVLVLGVSPQAPIVAPHDSSQTLLPQH